MRLGLVVTFFTVFIFCGCASALSPEQAAKNELLEYTSRASIMDKNVNILVVASYLNPVKYPKNLDEEIFGVAISPATTKLNGAFLMGSGKASIEIVGEDEANELGFYLPWASYYIVKAKSLKEARDLRLGLLVGDFSVKLDFVKVSRSLYWNR